VQQEREPVARIHFSTRYGTKRISIKDVNGELKEAIENIERQGGIVLRVSRAD
jgi:hypothetical protein